MVRIRIVLVMLFVSGLAFGLEQVRAAPSAPVAPTSQEVQEARQAAERALGAQTAMPGAKEIIREENRVSPERSSPARLPEEIARALLYLALAVGAVIILMTLRDNLWSASRSKRIAASGDEIAMPAEALVRLDQAQVAAEELAQRGSFAEAMHVLLLQSVGEMRQSLDIAIAASLTSREILERIALPSIGHQALADIINRVEISYFGPHQPQADDYEACRTSFAMLTETLRARVAA